MVDRVSRTDRSRMMAAVKNKNTTPELKVRSRLFRAGYRYRLHIRTLPGSPDIVLSRFRVAVFVHGCFWHGHTCPRGQRPQTNVDFWNAKLNQNLSRDRVNQLALQKAGWHVFIIWACQTDHDVERLLVYLDAQKGQHGVKKNLPSELS
jgi:DNA mismatch endonuclease (patch repair protein)